MYVTRLLIFSAVILLVDSYFFLAIRQLTLKWHRRSRIILYSLYWGFTAFAIGLLMYALTFTGVKQLGLQLYLFNVVLVLTIAKLLGSVPLLLNDLYRLSRWISGLFYKEQFNTTQGNKITRSAFLSKAALGVAAIPFLSLLYGMAKTAFDFTVRKATVKLPNLPAGFDGLKIVQISDIHSGSFIDDAPFHKAIKIIDELKPDIIFFTGDLVNNVADEVQNYISVLGKLKAPLGVYSVLGNHDYGDYVEDWKSVEEKKNNLDRLKQAHAQMGWRLLMNENVTLTRNGDSIALLGVENWGNKMHFKKYGKLNEAYSGVEDMPVKLLLSHDPSHWEGEVLPKYPDIDITFSGHTHGFQFGIEIPGLKWSPSQYLYKQWGGLYQKDKQYIYVNRGFGFLGYMGRVGIPPEITLMELKKA